MADLPKITKDADDLTTVERKPSWRRSLTSALTAVAASVVLSSVSAPPAQAASSPELGVALVGTPTAPAKLVFQQDVANMQAADHYSHESHASHVSHHSHYSGFQE
jgi:hypothetical protein